MSAWEEDMENRILEVETRLEHHADMIYNKLQKKPETIFDKAIEIQKEIKDRII